MKCRNENHIYNIGSGLGTSIKELIEIIENISGIRVRITLMPSKKHEIRHSVADISKIAHVFGFSHGIKLVSGITELYSRLKSNKYFR